ncbi:hypothetical protein H2198_004082 [Neophaeococcomyces mojaviensis]|uniref:Uncharacterized protein n=1 Tax=Neophaeococcomyces mojaviensis TaxID=3383035 RepID=A0ACC3AAB6_9EURO|nr:hypothetical protein H2198_004082 [Knufia sp. JES_112]
MPSSITLTVQHLASSTSFFLSALQPLNYVYRGRVDNTIGFGTKDSPPDFWISQETAGVPAGAAHVAFPATSRQNVQEFFIAALKAGGKCHGEPLLRDPSTGYFSAAVIDLDGNSIEAVYRPDILAAENESDESRPSSVSSAGSVKSKSYANMGTNAPSVVSKATTARPKSTVATEVRSVAPSQAPSKAGTQVSRAPTSVSKAPTQVSRAPTSVSKAPSQASRAPTAAPTTISRAPSQQSVARAPTTISRAPSFAPQQPPPPPQTQAVTQTTPTGEIITSIITEARNTINVARELVNQARPALDSSNSAPNLPTATRSVSDPVSHQPSDTIVGTLLGVAAGAALHYAYTKATENKSPAPAPPPAQLEYRPSLQRTSTAPSYAYDEEREYYYHDYAYTRQHQPYAIEAPPTEYAASQAPSQHSQRYITMYDTDERLSDIAPSAATGRPRRRSSFSAVDAGSYVSQSRASKNEAAKGRMLEAPPTSYRAPTAITMADTAVSGRSRSRSRIGSVLRAASISSLSKRSSRHASDEDIRSSARSHASRHDDAESRVSRRTSASKSRAPSMAGSDARTVVPIKSAASVAPSHTSKAPTAVSKAPTAVSKAPTAASKAPTSASRATTIRPEATPLPPSRAGTTISASPSDYHSTHSKSHKTVIGKMLERDRQEGGRGLTKSVVGKIEDACNVGVTDKEVDPSDSVSQISSNHSRKSKR